MISFILTVLNRQDLVAQFFIESLTRQTKLCEVILVDNGSHNTTSRYLDFLASVDKEYGTKVIHNIENTGFGPGNNQGALEAKGDILVFTQPDVILHEDVVPSLKVLEPDILYGDKLYNYDTGWNKFGDVVVSYLGGHFISCTRETWFKIGGFDPIYAPADFEDVDLSYTAVKMGIRLEQLNLRMTHLGGATWSQFPDRLEVTNRNRIKFAQKWGFNAR